MWNTIRIQMGVALAWMRAHRKASLWIIIAVFVLFVLLSFKSCASSPSAAAPTPGAGWLFLKLAFAGLIWTAYAAREKKELMWSCIILAIAVFLVLLGKLDGLMAWAILGFPIVAAIGVWGSMKSDGRMKSFLGFTSGILILFWMFLLYIEHSSKISIGFLGILFPDDLAKVIFTVFLAVFIFAIWKRSITFYSISFVILLSFLGNNMINEMIARFPDKFTPSINKEVSEGTGGLINSVGKAMKRLSDQLDNPKPQPAANSQQPTISAAPTAPAKVTAVVPIVAAPVTVGATPTPPASPAITPPTPEIWNLRFYRGHQMMEQKMSVTRTGADILIKATVDGTTFKGSFRRNRYEGTVAGPGSNGTFILHFLPNGEATGEVFVGQKIIISMTRLS